MLIGTKESYQQNTRSSLYTGTQCLSHKIRCILDTGSLADFAHHRLRHRCHYYNLPHLEAQT